MKFQRRSWFRGVKKGSGFFHFMKAALSIVACLTGLLAGCVQNTSSETWKEYKLADGSFSVKLPGPPTEKISTLKLPPGNADQHTYSSSQSGYVYKVMCLDYPLIRITDPNGVLDNICEGSASAVGGHVAKLTTISLASHPGRDFIIASSDGKPSAYCRYYMVNNTLIQLMALKKQSAKSTDDIDVFLRSLKLLKNR